MLSPWGYQTRLTPGFPAPPRGIIITSPLVHLGTGGIYLVLEGERHGADL